MKISKNIIAAIAALTVMSAAPAALVNAETYAGYSRYYSTGFGVMTDENNELQTPFVNTVTKSYNGVDGVKLTFSFEPSEGAYGFADGYEVKVSSRYINEKSWRKAEIVDIQDTEYVTGAQDDFEFAVKIRAYYEVNGSRVYSDWSSTAYGDTRM